MSDKTWEEVQRHWILAVVAKQYGCTPYQAALELDRDPERLALRLLPFYAYSEAYRHAKATTDWTKLEESDLMSAVMGNMLYLKHRRVVHVEKDPDCEDCV